MEVLQNNHEKPDSGSIMDTAMKNLTMEVL